MHHTRKRHPALILIFALILSLFATILVFLLHTPSFSSDTPQVLSQSESQDAPALTGSRKAGQYQFLLIGRDRASFCTDVMMLFTYDTVAQKLTCLQLPRDTYVSYSNARRLNAVFAQGYMAAKKSGADTAQAERAGMETLRNLISRQFGLPIDFTALLYLDTFANLVDQLGGVRVDVPFAMHYDDPTQNLHIHLEPGVQVLDGKAAEGFIRFRKTNQAGAVGYTMGDLGRVQAQKLFLAAIFGKVKELTPQTAIALAKTALTEVTTDLSAKDCVFFARHLLSLDSSALTMLTLPGWMGGGAYNLSRTDTLSILNTYFSVYESAYTTDTFDPGLAFCNQQANDASAIYYGHGADPQIFDGKSLLEKGFSDGELALHKH